MDNMKAGRIKETGYKLGKIRKDMEKQVKKLREILKDEIFLPEKVTFNTPPQMELALLEHLNWKSKILTNVIKGADLLEIPSNLKQKQDALTTFLKNYTPKEEEEKEIIEKLKEAHIKLHEKIDEYKKMSEKIDSLSKKLAYFENEVNPYFDQCIKLLKKLSEYYERDFQNIFESEFESDQSI